MLTISAPDSIVESVCRVELGLDVDEIVHSSSVQRGQDPDLGINPEVLERLEGDIIEIGKPRKWDLEDILSSQERMLPAAVQSLTADWKFWLVELSCAFITVPGHSVTWARFVAKLSVRHASNQPQVYDLYPLEIYDQIEQKREVSVGVDLKFAAQVNLGKYLTEIKYIKLDPKVVATFGEGRRFPTWNFTATPVSDVRGYKPLYLIVQMPRTASSLDIEFGLFARARVKWGIFPLSKKKILAGHEQVTI